MNQQQKFIHKHIHTHYIFNLIKLHYDVEFQKKHSVITFEFFFFFFNPIMYIFVMMEKLSVHVAVAVVVGGM